MLLYFTYCFFNFETDIAIWRLAAASDLRISLIHLRKAMADAAMDEDQLQLVWAPSIFFRQNQGSLNYRTHLGVSKNRGIFDPPNHPF